MTVVPFTRPDEDEPLLAPPPREAERRLYGYAKLLRAVFFAMLAISSTLVATGAMALLLRNSAYVVAGTVGQRLSFLAVIGTPTTEMTGQHFVPAYKLPILTTTVGAPIFLLRFLPGLLILLFLYKLFNLYARGEVFTFATTSEIRNISYSVLAYSCISLITHPIMYLLGLFPELISYDMQQIDAFFLGIILLAVTYVMQIGNRIQEEQKDYI